MDAKHFRQRTLGLSGALVIANIAAWVWAYLVFRDQPVLLGTAFLAYSFGLRHALDADHIAAIDNVTRKLVQNGDRPVSVGFYFALGHSTVVMIAVLIVYWTAAIASERFKQWQEVGEMISTCVSACFLFAIALINLLAMQDTYRALKKQKRESATPSETVGSVAGQGIVSRLLRPLNVMVLPVLFAAGMTLVDSADGMIMVGAYNWAFINPIRKLYYNLTITFVSVVVGVVVGGIELVGLVKDKLNLDGGWFWSTIGILQDNFGAIGLVIVGVFVLTWLISAIVYRVKKLDPAERSGEMTE
jgi:high-affinity nickel-transport protein